MSNSRGAEIRRLRKAAGISLTALANHPTVGLETHAFLSRAERDEVHMPEALYYKCRAALYDIAAEKLEAVSDSS